MTQEEMKKNIENEELQNEETEKNEVPPEKQEESETKEERSTNQENSREPDWKDQYLRLAAEYENYRKRIAREMERIRVAATEKVWLELFPLVDDIYRAIEAASQSDNIESIREGLALIQNKISKMFEKNQIEPIQDKGAEFDSNLHEAVAWIQAPDEEQKGKIIDVIEKGYKLGDKVIKHSKVVVGK